MNGTLMKSAGENKSFSRNYSLNIHGRLLDLNSPVVMGVINVTPDSFFGESRAWDENQVIVQAEAMLQEGASILDIGGYSSRPGAADIPIEIEMERVIPAIRAIARRFPKAIVSVDTFRSAVARAAVAEGASLINDISGGELDPEMLTTVGELKVPYILMHMRGTPLTMTTLNSYENLHLELISWVQRKLALLQSLNVKDVIVDPGFGFAKSIQQNFQLLNMLELFRIVDCPLMVGLSRKSMIWKTLNVTPDQALNGTSVLNTVALMKGASILRVHDVKEAVEAVKLFRALN